MTPEMVRLVADRFKALGEPVRLAILSVLREGAMTVGDIVEATGLGQANVSKHLQFLHATGLVTRRKDGLHVHYSLADAEVFRMCDVMCGHLEAEASARTKVLATR